MNIHFIALGGSVMHSLAIALKEAGHTVSGSDDAFYDPSRSRLEEYGLLPEKDGWHPDRIHKNLDVVILGMHAFKDNPELARAQELGLKIQSFPEFVYEHSKNKQRIVIAGSCGKTTITGMVMHALKAAGRSFDYLVGAQIPGFDNPVKLSQDAPMIVVEGDEYLASRIDPRPKFLFYNPHIVAITGVSWDHINVFPSELEYIDAFDNLIGMIPKAGTIIYNKEDQTLESLVKAYADEAHYVEEYKSPKYRVNKGRFEVNVNKTWLPMRMIGRHNMENMSAAAKVCQQAGVGEEAFFQSMQDYEGAQFRQEIVHDDSTIRVYRDYAHAPEKVRATLNAVRELFPESHITAAVELHTFSSLDKQYLQNYADTLRAADEAIVVVDAKTLERKRKEAISEEEIFEAFNRRTLRYIKNLEELPSVVNYARAHSHGKHEVLLMMSSGNFGGIDFKVLV